MKRNLLAHVTSELKRTIAMLRHREMCLMRLVKTPLGYHRIVRDRKVLLQLAKKRKTCQTLDAFSQVNHCDRNKITSNRQNDLKKHLCGSKRSSITGW